MLFVALAGYGHVTPTLPLVEELVQRGHRVGYATAVDFADVVTSADAQWSSCRRWRRSARGTPTGCCGSPRA